MSPGNDVLTPSKLRLVLANGSLAQYPQGGGHWTVFLQYLLGLSALGHHLFWLELLKTTGNPTRDQKLIRIFLTRFRYYGLGANCAVLLVKGDLNRESLESMEVYGATKCQIQELIRRSDLLWNFCCTLRPPLLSMFKRRAVIDLDPGLLQVPALSYDFGLSGHEFFLTVGSNMSEPDCQVPDLGYTWYSFMPFVYLPSWNVAPDPGYEAPFSSVTQWTWNKIEIFHNERVLSISKRDAFLRYLEMPRRAGRGFELAANIHPRDVTGDRELLLGTGWTLVNPHRVAISPRTYQNYINKSRAEFSCPKPIYRQLNTGWFSDRSAAYLASGRPVLAEDTGFKHHIPIGSGLITFTDLDEASAGVAEIDGNYPRHARAARELAEEHLNAEKWLRSMLAACGW
jgi:hypothetical protein